MNKYVLAKDADFSGYKDGEFQYIGQHEYVIIPEYIKGVKITKTSDEGFDSLFEKTQNIKGVYFQGGKNITNMSSLFSDVKSETLELKYLDTSNVENMHAMFFRATINELDLTSFNTKKVKSFSAMFAHSNIGSIEFGNWDTSNAETFSGMFSSSKTETLNLSSFNTSKVKDMSKMFSESLVKEVIGLKNFDTANVVSMKQMFYSSKIKYLDLSSFNTSNVRNMESMFFRIEIDSLDLSNFITSKVEDMGGMFAISSINNLNISSFDTNSVSSMVLMFWKTKTNTLDLSNFNLTNVIRIDQMFAESEITLLDISSFNIEHIRSKEHFFDRAQIYRCIVGSQRDQNLFSSLIANTSPLFSFTSVKDASINFIIKKELNELELELLFDAIIETRAYILQILTNIGLYKEGYKIYSNKEPLKMSFEFSYGGYAKYDKQESKSLMISKEELNYCAQLLKDFKKDQSKYMFVDNKNEFIELNDAEKACIVSPGDLITGDELKYIQSKIENVNFITMVQLFAQLNNIFEIITKEPYTYNLHKSLTRSFITIKNIIKGI